MSTASARMAIDTFDRCGKTNRSNKDSLLLLNRCYNAAGTMRGCPICFHQSSHPFTACPALSARGFSVTYNVASDTNPDLGFKRIKPGVTPSVPIVARKASTVRTDLQSQVDDAVTAKLATIESTIQSQVNARLASLQVGPLLSSPTRPSTTAPSATGRRTDIPVTDTTYTCSWKQVLEVCSTPSSPVGGLSCRVSHSLPCS